ncbi:hypothetical protein VB264_15235 [Arcicella aquatica]|uniref:VWFA domain-containing protein n=1 Tax=Arcicella aquatica TaxID=217141 RepID=A0ABU5QQY6_9BACT|nr:hypothetical protein [Arcicella aquatica]MEA5259149.1 hypothetical protein [Arcicella aquatica]
MKNTLKKLKIMLIWALFSAQSIAQTKPDNVIILVNVSKSVLLKVKNPHEIAPSALYPLISSGQLSSAFFFIKKPKQSLLKTNWMDEKKKIMLIPFGDLSTDVAVRRGVSADEYSDTNKDFFKNALFKKWPDLTKYKDSSSYRRLAIARAADLAQKNGFSSYWLLIVGDNIDSEKRGIMSFETEVQNVLNKYKPSEDMLIGTIKLTRLKNDFGAEVRHIVLDTVNISPFGKKHSIIVDTVHCVNTEITFIKKSSKDNRIVFDESKAKLSWECTCDTVSEYTVSVIGTDGAEVSPNLRTLKTNDTFVSLKSLNSGNYNVTVVAGGISSTSYITVKGSNLVIWLIVIALIILVGYFGKNNIKHLLAVFDRKRKKSNNPSNNTGDSDTNSNQNYDSSGY